MPLNTDYIATRRAFLNLTQQQAGIAAVFDPLHATQRWSDYERGRPQSPTLATLEALAKALRCDIGKLVE